ncbi:TPA: hypothetical protein N0F65_004070 [Lagenidium giganteum]|uniref:Uncharacterized protein n=1 Tax=Lagenidium giganteum TaxID=4803 RepID=A0AAV2YXM6_9STRA|nr:TPA: hypothetical protein N0F65_004070 [Lagenidium giganteum]
MARALYAAAKNGAAMPCAIDAGKFIVTYPRGAYTAARTVEQTKVFDYHGHIKRLVDSTMAMHPTTQFASASDVERWLRPRTEATLVAAMKAFTDAHGTLPPQDEYKLTVLICAPEEHNSDRDAETLLAATDVYCHVGLLPPLRSELVKLLVAGMPRPNAHAKDTAWVRERKAIYDAMPADVEEIVLMDPATHELLEGSQTNFYAVRDGAIYTAEDGILKGTVRSLVLDVCKARGIPVKLTPPRLDDVDSWEGCFISSTSRLVLGAKSLDFVDPATQQKVTRTFPSSPLVEQLTQWVRASVIDKSTQVFPSQ